MSVHGGRHMNRTGYSLTALRLEALEPRHLLNGIPLFQSEAHFWEIGFKNYFQAQTGYALPTFFSDRRPSTDAEQSFAELRLSELAVGESISPAAPAREVVGLLAQTVISRLESTSPEFATDVPAPPRQTGNSVVASVLDRFPVLDLGKLNQRLTTFFTEIEN